MMPAGIVRVIRPVVVACMLYVFLFLSGTALAATTTFSYAGPPVAIPDAPGAVCFSPWGVQAEAPIVVSGIAGTVAKVTMSIDGTECSTGAGSATVGIDHTYVSDLQIKLRAPDGTEVLVIDFIDGDGNNFCQVVLDDEAATSIQTAVSAQAPFTGTWQPNAPLSTFAGKNANGTWSLLAQDACPGDAGNIRAWSITITDNPAPVPAPSVSVPTLSEWGMIIFLVCAGLGSVLYLRRQRSV